MVNWELAAVMLCPALGRLREQCDILTSLSELSVRASQCLHGLESHPVCLVKHPVTPAVVGLLHSLLYPAWSGAAVIILRLMSFFLLTSARFFPLEICHTVETGSQGAFSCLDSEVEFRYYTLPPSFHSQAA